MGLRRLYIHNPPKLGLRLEFEPEDLTFAALVTEGRFTKNRGRSNFNGAAHPERGNAQDKTGTPVELAWRLAHNELPKLEDMVREDYIAGEIDAFGAEVRGTTYDNGNLLIQGEWDEDTRITVPFPHGPGGFVEPERSKGKGKDKRKILDGIPFVLGIVGERYVDFRGFYVPKNRLRRTWWRDDIPRPCYYVPQSALFSLIPFLDEKTGALDALTHPRVLLQNWYQGEDGEARFDRVQRVTVGRAIPQEEADQTGVIIVAQSEDYNF